MLDDLVRSNLLAIVAAWRRATGVSMTTASKRFYGNSTFFEDLKRGRSSISIAKLSEMLDHIRAEWPEGAEWPPVRAVHMGRQPQNYV